ncbi:MAG: 4Fe-4S binding protein [Patescibacteria group bacterium]
MNLNKCRGCSICQLVCPYGCLKPKVALFDDLLAQ